MDRNLPTLAAIAAARNKHPDGRLVQNDSDRIALFDGFESGSFLLTIDGKNGNPTIEVERIADGWRASFYYDANNCFTRAAATWREVVDLMADPPVPKEPREIPHAANPDWDDPVNARA